MPQTPDTVDGVPLIVVRLTQEVERRGLTTEGLYRLSAVKSQVEQMCADFEANPRTVNMAVDVRSFVSEGAMSGVSLPLIFPFLFRSVAQDVHVLTSVLKLYFRQLPEAVVPPPHARTLLALARDRHAEGVPIPPARHARCLAAITTYVERALPPVNYTTLAYTVLHLRRVAAHAAENRMKPANLGIVFGPTLLGAQTGDSLASLMDMPFQSQLIELMIENAEQVFARYVHGHASPASANAVPGMAGVSVTAGVPAAAAVDDGAPRRDSSGFSQDDDDDDDDDDADCGGGNNDGGDDQELSGGGGYAEDADADNPDTWDELPPLPTQDGSSPSLPARGATVHVAQGQSAHRRPSLNLSDYSDTDEGPPAAESAGHAVLARMAHDNPDVGDTAI